MSEVSNVVHPTPLQKSRRIFCHQPSRRLAATISDYEEIPPLKLSDLLTLSRDDVIVTARPWCILFEFLFFFYSDRRPWLVQASDGVLFPLNSRKIKNRRYGGQFHRVFADLLLVAQNPKDLTRICIENEGVIYSTYPLEVDKVKEEFAELKVILVASNDPYFDFSKEQVVEEYCKIADSLVLMGATSILMTTTSKSLEKAILRRTSNIRMIGRMSSCKEDLSGHIAIGSPGTVLIEEATKGRAVFLMSLYGNCGLESYFNSEKTLLRSVRTSKGWLVQRPVVRSGCQSRPISTKNLVDRLLNRRHPSIVKSEFLRNFNFVLLARDIQVMIKENFRSILLKRNV